MDLHEHFVRLYMYDEWANREALRSLRNAATLPAKSKRWLAHIVAAEWLWLSRLQQQTSPMAVWPEMDLDDCEAQISSISRGWQQYLEALTPDALAQEISYVNSRGERFASAIQDILLHVVMHAAYHRGQIAADVRASGSEPAYTDFIHAVRQGMVE
jgi:uncharacterized damage-inducible protein DinB